MTDSVVSTHYGKRPLLEVPALQIISNESSAVPSLQAPTLPYTNNSSFPNIPNAMHGPDAYNHRPSFHAPGTWQQNRMQFPGLHRNHSAPPGHYSNLQDLQYHRPGAYPSPTYAPQRMHHQMTNDFSVYNHAPLPPPARPPYPSYGLPNIGYNITCDLEYGRIVNIDLRDCFGEFRGVPPFLRSELMRTYGSHPHTKVKVRLEGEEFHVYASHDEQLRRRRRRRRDSDTESDRYFDDDDFEDEEEEDRLIPRRGRRSEVDSDRRRLRFRDHRDRPRGVMID